MSGFQARSGPSDVVVVCNHYRVENNPIQVAVPCLGLLLDMTSARTSPRHRSPGRVADTWKIQKVMSFSCFMRRHPLGPMRRRPRAWNPKRKGDEDSRTKYYVFQLYKHPRNGKKQTNSFRVCGGEKTLISITGFLGLPVVTKLCSLLTFRAGEYITKVGSEGRRGTRQRSKCLTLLLHRDSRVSPMRCFASPRSTRTWRSRLLP